MQEIFDNIKARYKFNVPCKELAAFIEYFWESSFEECNDNLTGDSFMLKLFPSCTPTFLINLGNSYHLISGEKMYKPGPEDDILICRNNIVEYHHTRKNKLFGVKFFAGGLQALLNMSLADKTDKVFGLDDFISSLLIKKIKKANSFHERINILEGHLLNRYWNTHEHNRQFMLVQKVIMEYESGDMEFKNAEIAARLFVTPKTLYRNFTRLVGVSPKNYFFIMRARTALTAYVKCKDRFVAMDYGYYDMSHFYKDVIKFTGKKLSEQNSRLQTISGYS